MDTIIKPHEAEVLFIIEFSLNFSFVREATITEKKKTTKQQPNLN